MLKVVAGIVGGAVAVVVAGLVVCEIVEHVDMEAKAVSE